MVESVQKIPNARSASVKLEIEINAPRDKVFDAITRNLNSWWPKELHIFGEGSKMSFDPKPGGNMVETSEDGGGIVWGTVLTIIPPQSMQAVGHVLPPWGGPCVSYVDYSLEEKDDGTTLLKFTDYLVGEFSDKMLSSLDGGWKLAFEQNLKPFCEGM